MGSTNDKIRGNWNELKGKLQAKYGELTDDDLAYQQGKEDELIGRIQQRIGESKDEVKRIIDNL
jgi:uncharacterized protein YjbJ (UPF0337 family)